MLHQSIESCEVDEYGETVRVHGLVVRANMPRDGEPGSIEVYRERGYRPLSADETATLGALFLELSEVIRLDRRPDRG